MNNVYKITAPRESGAMYIMYNAAGEVKEVLFDFKPALGPYIAGMIAKFFPFNESQITALAKGAEVEATLLQAKSAAEKIAMFCMTYRAYRNSPYTAKKEERANIKQVTVSDKLLAAYFSNTSFPLNYAKSVNDYIKHYNYIRDIATNGTPTKTTFPDVPDRDYERTLEGEKLSAYWQHLLKLGWKKKDGAWVKEMSTQTTE